MQIITIDVECRDGIITRHFCTVISDASEIHKALMDSVNFIKSIGWLYIEHTITVHAKGTTPYEDDNKMEITT